MKNIILCSSMKTKNAIYEPYKDEINAWNVKVLHGNLENLK